MPILEALFCHADDCCQWFEPRWQQRFLGEGLQRHVRSHSLSEIIKVLHQAFAPLHPRIRSLNHPPSCHWNKSLVPPSGVLSVLPTVET